MRLARRQPSKADVSRAQRAGDYSFKKRFYQSDAVAADYDFHRWGSPERTRRNAKKWKTIQRALTVADGVGSVLDLPCGTGRFTGLLAQSGYRVVGSDISQEMMLVAMSRAGQQKDLYGFVRADAERLPHADGSFDCVMSIRFLFHIDPATRVRILREMGRVSRRWVILDYRHRYSLRYALWKVRRAFGLTREPLARVSRAQLQREFSEAGISIRKVIPVARIFSDKWIVVGET